MSPTTYASRGGSSASGGSAGYTNVRTFGAVGDGVADDTVAAREAARSRGLVYWPAGTYNIRVSEAAAITGLEGGFWLGDPNGRTTIAFIGISTDRARNGIVVTAGRFTMGMIRIVAPTFEGLTERITWTALFHSNEAEGTLDVFRCHFEKHTYAIRTWARGTHKVNVENTLIEGNSGIVPGQIGIHVPGAAGAEVHLNQVRFRKLGDTSNHFGCHALYLYEPVALYATDCEFEELLGRCTQWFSEEGLGTPRFCVFNGCRFGREIPRDVEGIVTNAIRRTRFINCIFEHPGYTINAQGDVDFVDPEFNNQVAEEFYGIIEPSRPARIRTIDGNWNCNNRYGLKINRTDSRVKIRGGDLSGRAQFYFAMREGSGGSILDVSGVEALTQSEVAASAIIQSKAAAIIRLFQNTFASTLVRDAIHSESELGVLRTGHNEFSQAGESFAGTALRAENNIRISNYGVRGF